MKTMAEEIWKQIPEHPKYEASNLGNIRNDQKKVMKLRIHRTNHGKEYLVITLRDGSRNYAGRLRTKNFKVGRLILQAFVGPASFFKPLCCHIDDDGFNNKLDNLKWGDNAENQAERANPLCENCTKGCRQDSHDETDQCTVPYCGCTGWKKKKKTLFVWGKSLEIK